MTIQQIIKKLFDKQTELKITNDQLAALTGLNKSTLYRIKFLKHTPGVDALQILCNALSFQLTIESIVSNCCSAPVINERCKECKEHCQTIII